MADKKKDKSEKVVVAEYKVYMHCNACERSVAKVISKIKGVEKFTTDMPNNKVVVTGKINLRKVMKKLEKKTGKRVEVIEEAKQEEEEEESNLEPEIINPMLVEEHSEESELYMMFSDENPNACSIM